MKCEFEGCNEEAKAGGLCWQHQMCGIEVDSESIARFKKRVDQIPVVGIAEADLPKQPTADTEISDRELRRLTERIEDENDCIAVLAGKTTWHKRIGDLKSLGIIKIIGLGLSLITALLALRKKSV